MYFFKKNGKQHLDFRGNLILSHNVDLVRTRAKSCAPRYTKNALYIVNIPNLKFFRKIRATVVAVRFIWGKSRAMEARTIGEENGLKEGVK